MWEKTGFMKVTFTNVVLCSNVGNSVGLFLIPQNTYCVIMMLWRILPAKDT
jgi:hypothetical protein